MSSETSEKPAAESNSNNANTNNKSLAETWGEVKEYIGKARDFVESIDIKESVRVRREQLNNAMEKNFLLAESMKVAMHPEALFKDVHSGLYSLSTSLNEKYPYPATLCRTHDYLLVSAAAVFVSFPLLRVSKKFAFMTSIFTGALAKGATSVVNYKWENSPEFHYHHEQKDD